MLKVLSIFGTRPEAIKMAPVVRELEKYPRQVISKVCVTGQHRQMLDQVLDLFHLCPDYDLKVMQESQTPIQVASIILDRLEPVLSKEAPDWVLIQGDTTSVMAAALAAFYAHIRIGHVEAGLRTFDKWQPFPEEINRRVAGLTADLHFAPTKWARGNLIREGVPETSIIVTGNPVIDALQWVVKQPFSEDNLLDIPNEKRLILITAHRRENYGKPLEEICLALKQIAKEYCDEIHLIFPVHLNPNVREPVTRLLNDIPNITLTEPLDYQPLVHLMKKAYLVLTDSGGIQEEAPSLGKPVLVLRSVTERPEAVQAGTVKLVGTDRKVIVQTVQELLENRCFYDCMAQAVNPYGDGRAAERIIKVLLGESIDSWIY